MNKPEIKITVDGVEFEIGEEVEYSHGSNVSYHRGTLIDIATKGARKFLIKDKEEYTTWVWYIRKLSKPKLHPRTAEELCRWAGKEGLEVKIPETRELRITATGCRTCGLTYIGQDGNPRCVITGRCVSKNTDSSHYEFIRSDFEENCKMQPKKDGNNG